MIDEEQEPEHQVDDPEDYAQRERLKHIYQARREFLEARAEAPQLRRKEDWNLPEYQDYIYNALQRYFFEVEGLMRRHPEGDHYLHDVPLGGVVHYDNVVLEDGERGVRTDLDEDFEPDRAFVGLESMGKKYRPIRTTGYKVGRDAKETKDTAVLVTVPVQVSMRAYRKINEFLAEVGLDADMEGDTEEAEYDYSDLLEEGPPSERDGERPEVATDGGGGDE